MVRDVVRAVDCAPSTAAVLRLEVVDGVELVTPELVPETVAELLVLGVLLEGD